MEKVFAPDPTGKLRAAWNVKEQVRALQCTGSLADAAAAKDRLEYLVRESGQPVDANAVFAHTVDATTQWTKTIKAITPSAAAL